MFAGLSLAVGGGGVNRTTEKCSLVTYVPPHLGALTTECPAPLGGGVPQACVCCDPHVPAPLISGREETRGADSCTSPCCPPAPGDMAHYAPQWQLALPLSAGMR